MATEFGEPKNYSTSDVLQYVGEQLDIYQEGEWANRLTEIHAVLSALGNQGVELDAPQYEEAKKLVNECVDAPEKIETLLNYLNSLTE